MAILAVPTNRRGILMILNGALWLNVPADLVAKGFDDPGILATFLPGNSELTATGPGSFDFVIVKETGIVTLRLPGSLSIHAEGSGRQFSAAARHILGGSATLSLHLGFADKDGGCALTYDGTLESTGLAGRLLRDRADQAQDMIDARFAAVRVKLESRYRPPST
jgi:carbon monoxide dehydrogenase subunit G